MNSNVAWKNYFLLSSLLMRGDIITGTFSFLISTNLRWWSERSGKKRWIRQACPTGNKKTSVPRNQVGQSLRLFSAGDVAAASVDSLSISSSDAVISLRGSDSALGTAAPAKRAFSFYCFFSLITTKKKNTQKLTVSAVTKKQQELSVWSAQASSQLFQGQKIN